MHRAKILRVSLRGLLALIVTAVLSSKLLANPIESKIVSSDIVDRFGEAVAIDGDIAVVGVPLDSSLAFRAGSAYVFRNIAGSWIEQQKLFANTPTINEEFGRSVAISGDRIVIGSESLADDRGFQNGSAYIFEFDGMSWSEQQELQSNEVNLGFATDGVSVAIHNDTVVVGDLDAGQIGGSSGRAFVFIWDGTTWVFEEKLLPPDPNNSNEFGFSVDVFQDRVIVGAPSDSPDLIIDAGSSYVFERVSGIWSAGTKIVASDGVAGANFGYSVGIDQDAAVVGAIGFTTCCDSTQPGAAYVFIPDAGTWTEEQKLTASDAAAQDRFGRTVAISGDAIAVGAADDDDDGASSGSAYLYLRDSATGNWVEEPKITASDAGAGDFFGQSVSLDGNTLAVGAPFEDENANNSGSVYLYELDIVSEVPTFAVPVLPLWGLMTLAGFFGLSTLRRMRSIR